MALMKKKHWDMHNKAVNDFHDDAFQQTVIHYKVSVRTNVYQEEVRKKEDVHELKGLVQYNQFRAWPITLITDSGELDKQSCLVYFNLKYLEREGKLNEHGQFSFDPGLDRFEINGVMYKSMGDSEASQAEGNPQLVFIILKRESIDTEDKLY